MKETVLIKAGFCRSAEKSNAFLVFPMTRVEPKDRCVMSGVGRLFLCMTGLLTLAFLTNVPFAWGSQRPIVKTEQVDFLPVQMDASEEELLQAQRIASASGNSVTVPTPTLAPDMPPTPAPSQVQAPVPVAPPVLPSVPSSPPTGVSVPKAGTLPPVAVPQSAEGASKGADVTAPVGEDKDEIYYDSLPLPPSGAMAKAAGPREVNPRLEPAQKFVIVKKTKDAGGLESLLVSANRALALGRYDSALDMFTQLYRKNPRDARILMGRAVALQHVGRREAAISAYEDLLKVDPSSIEAKINKAGLVGIQYPAVALRDLLSLRDISPGHAGLAAQIGLMQAKLGNDAEAMQYLGSAASLEPRNASHVYNMAVIADRMDDRVKAIALYEQALQLDGGDTQGIRVNRDAVYARLSVLREGKK